MKLVMVTGGRDYADYDYLAKVLVAELTNDSGRYLGQQFAIVQGGARGADALAKRWCENRGIPCFECRANWDVYGNGAGAIRNDWMLQLPIAKVIAFPGGSGTKNAIDKAYKDGIEVQVEKPTEHKWYEKNQEQPIA